jgi:asparagine synthase (glutamine-hydrolysing)
VPLHFVSMLARQHVTVVLTGEGSDELLAAYGKYPRAIINWRAGGAYERLVPASLRAAVAESIVPRLPGQAGRYARRSFLAMPRSASAMLLDNFAGMPLHQQRDLLSSSVARRTRSVRLVARAISTPSMDAAVCSAGCCIRTSRPTSSSC